MEEIREKLQKVIGRVFGIEFVPEVTVAPELEGETDFRADYATNVAMKLAGKLKKETGEKRTPREIAEKIKNAEELSEYRIEIAGPGFINFMLGNNFFTQQLKKFVNDFEKKITQEDYKGKVVVVEFSDPNPFKVLHIGHLYTSIFGEAISRLIEFSGGEVHRVNFGGDVGLHVAKTLYVLVRNQVNVGSFTIEDIAKAYVEGTRIYEEDEKAKKEIVRLNKEIYEIAEKNIHKGEVAELYWAGRELSYKYFEQFYDRIGVKFEKFYPESTVVERGKLEVNANLGKVYEESNGAIVFKGEVFGLHTRVFINKEGVPTYEAKDVGLIFTKYDDYKFDKSIVITGNEQADYMKVVLKSIEQFAPKLAETSEHITHGMVRLPGNEKMSSRKGNFVKAVDVLDGVEMEMKNTTKNVGEKSNMLLVMGAIKYAFLKYRIGGDIEFSVKESVNLAGNSGPYLQYATVRAKKILKNIGLDEELNEEEYEFDEMEVRLMKKIVQYPETLKEALKEKAPHIVCNYLFEIAQEFSRFYEKCKVVGDMKEQQRGRMVEVYKKIMEHGLGILGIEVPEEM